MRSILFNILFIGWAFISAVLFLPFFIIGGKPVQYIGTWWANVALFFAKYIAGIRYEIRGRENIPHGAAIYASKHQSAWDTLIFHHLFSRATYVLKKELLKLPFWGWYLWRMGMIAINRNAGAASIKQLIRDSKKALEDNRPIVIFPEGTRTAPNAPALYHTGILALYNQGAPIVPVALNSGYYWGKNAFFKRSGTIIIEFLPAVPAGLDKKIFMQQLQTSIETASQKLLNEALSQHTS